VFTSSHETAPSCPEVGVLSYEKEFLADASDDPSQIVVEFFFRDAIYQFLRMILNSDS
jgi:hypothetical protein